MRLYTISGAPRGWRVQTALMLKGLSYELQILEASKQEHQKEPYLNINPRGLVPVIEHKGQFISDSLGIMAWLDRLHPERPLFGVSPEEAGAIWSLATDLEDHMRPAHHAYIFPLLVQGKSPDDMPSDEMGMMMKHAANLLAEFEKLEAHLSDGPYLIGQAPSAADAVAYPEARLIHRANFKTPEAMAKFGFDDFPERFPKIDAWMKQIEALPNFEKSLPPHWSA